MRSKHTTEDVISTRKALCEAHDISARAAGRRVFFSVLQAVNEAADIRWPTDLVTTAEQTLPSLPADEFTEFSPPTSAVTANPAMLDSLYQGLIPHESRRTEGQFFTPLPVARYMAEQLPTASGRVLDPTTGTGVFLQTTRETMPDAEVVAIDKDPLLALAAHVRLELLGETGSATVEVGDFLMDDLQHERFDAVICNPPYNKFHAYDNGGVARFEQRHGVDLGGFSNIYPLFFLRAAEYLAPGGRLVFITPGEFLDTGFGEGLRRFFLDNMEMEALVRLDWEDGVFDALTTVAITILRKGEPADTVPFVRSVTPDDLPDLPVEHSAGHARHVPTDELDVAEKWGRYLENIDGEQFLDATDSLSKTARTKRGIATGCNDFFTLTAAEIETWGIEAEFLVPVLSKATQAPHYTFTDADLRSLREGDKNVSLLWITGKPSENVRAYLEHGKEEYGAHERYLTSNRDPWYAPEKREPAGILATVFSRDNMRFVHNRCGVRNLASFHCIYPETTSETETKALLGYLNSETALELAKLEKRTYADGLTKFEPGDLDRLPTLDVRRLGDESVEKLADAFDALDYAERKEDEPTLERARVALDETVRDLLVESRVLVEKESILHWTDAE